MFAMFILTRSNVIMGFILFLIIMVWLLATILKNER
jgi:hypothetical protein